MLSTGLCKTTEIQVVGIKRQGLWGDREDEALENRISASIKGPHKAPEPLPPYEDT